MVTNAPEALESLKRHASRFFDRPSYSMPVFLSDTTLCILDDRRGVQQLSYLEVALGRVTPATAFPDRILSMHAAPGGTVVFGMDAAGDERQQVWTLTAGEASPRKLTDRPDAIHEPGTIARDGSFALVKSNARDEASFDVVGIDLRDGAIDPWLEAAGTPAPVALSRDGGRALVIRTNTNLDADVLLVDRATKVSRNLTEHEGEAWILGAAFHTGEHQVWFLTNEGADFVRLDAVDLDSGERSTIHADEWDVEAFHISPNGRRVAIAVNENGWSRVSIISVDSDEQPLMLDRLPRGTIDRFAWSPDGETLAFGLSTATDPSAIVIVEAGGEIRTISGEQEADRPPTVEPELVHYPTFDGREIPAFLLKPKGDGPFPVLVEVHGGPESQRRLQYTSAIPTDQFIQSLGIAVLSLNVRGSTGYGKTYSHLDDRELRLDSVRDVAAAVDWLHKRDDVIPDRIAVMGQSYGGFMTLASIAFHPDLWAAAVDVVGIANFVSFLERTGPWRRKNRSAEYGFLEHDRDMLERISPLNHVDRITTPLFVIHGRNDPRVPLFEAEQIVAALQERGQEVELRVFDDEGHGLAKKPNRVSGYAEAAAFLMRHLLGQAGTPA